MATPAPRFVSASPLPSIPSILIDRLNTGVHLADTIARARGAQARIMWVDGTANLDRVNTEEKVVALVKQLKEVGFNIIVFDVKPISGQTLYNSALRPKITEWRGRTLPLEFDPLEIMAREAKAQKISLWVSLNAFSEGHSMFKVGPGYATPELQTVVYEPLDVLRAPDGRTMPVTFNPPSLTPGMVGVYPNGDASPAAQVGATYVAVRKNGTVAEILRDAKPTVPKNGHIIASLENDFLSQAITVGARPPLDTLPDFKPISAVKNPQIPLMMNPHDPRVRDMEIAVAEELAKKYVLDGIVYDDRLRYAGLNADFSDTARRIFESHVGKTIAWPDDVFKFTVRPNGMRGIQPGPLYSTWMTWRAQRLADWVRDVRRKLNQTRPGMGLGLYAGSWYGEYQGLGNNWAGKKPQAGFWFLDEEYKKTGMATLFDWISTGCYYDTPTIYDAFQRGVGLGASVEAAGAMSTALVDGGTWTYAGIALSDYKDDPQGLRNALQAATASTQGVMCFDLSHDTDPMMPIFREAFLAPKTPPHAIPNLLQILRNRRAALPDVPRPVITFTGSAGTGQ